MEKLIVFGGSGSGKTSAVYHIRSRGDVVVPKRFVTRDSRLNDSDVENKHVTDAAFSRMVDTGDIVHPWERDLGRDKGRVRYGFAPIIEWDGMAAVYSANNAFPLSRSGQELLDEGAWPVLISSAQRARVERLHRRSPDIIPSEREERLKDVPPQLLEIPGLITIDNPQIEAWADGDVSPAALALDSLLCFIQENKPHVGEIALESIQRVCYV